MNLSLVQEQAITARMALIVGAKTFDRLFQGVQFSEVDGDILYCFAMNEELAAEMENKFALHIAIVAADLDGALRRHGFPGGQLLPGRRRHSMARAYRLKVLKLNSFRHIHTD
jgi:hypothetical protein